MTDLDPISPAGYAVYKLLSVVGGKDLKQAKLEELRERRQEFLEANEIMGGTPFITERVMETLIDMALEETEYMPKFEPDLLIISRQQYRELVGISAAVPLNPDKANEIIPGSDVQGLRAVQPPYTYKHGNSPHGIEVTFSEATDRMLLVDSSKLSETKYL